MECFLTKGEMFNKSRHNSWSRLQLVPVDYDCRRTMARISQQPKCVRKLAACTLLKPQKVSQQHSELIPLLWLCGNAFPNLTAGRLIVQWLRGIFISERQTRLGNWKQLSWLKWNWWSNYHGSKLRSHCGVSEWCLMPPHCRKGETLTITHWLAIQLCLVLSQPHNPRIYATFHAKRIHLHITDNCVKLKAAYFLY